MRPRRWAVLGILVLAAVAAKGVGWSGGGMTRYVAPGGSDTNDGSKAHPYATIQKAAEVVNPGDTVIVRDGI
jgi:hypothetical protein